MTPQRIIRNRQKGWRKPENCIIVSRPSKYGNFLKLVGNMIYIDAKYRRTVFDRWVFLCFGDIDLLLELYEAILKNDVKYLSKSIKTDFYFNFMNGVTFLDDGDVKYWLEKCKKLDLSQLKDKDLACYCKLSEPCHADILLKITNQ
jgi:Domain of unknown function (DUF4326)